MARRLYETYAASQPILDYHSHLPPGDIARDRRFRNLFEVALEGDHYKWRAMRANGVSERYCTGDASPEENFMAWARTLPYRIRNPLFLRTDVDAKRHFAINHVLNDEHSEPLG